MTTRSTKGTKVTTLAGFIRSYVGSFWDEDATPASVKDNPIALSLFKDLIDDVMFRALDGIFHLSAPTTDFLAFDTSDAITNAGALYTVNREFYAIINGTFYKVNTGSDTLVDTLRLVVSTTEDGMYKTLDIEDGTSGSGVVDIGDIDYIKDLFSFDVPNLELRVKAITDEDDTGAVDFPRGLLLASGADVLDDYEEGTFTPTLTTSAVDFDSVTYDGQTAAVYTKVGRMVFVHGTVYTDAITIGSASGTVAIGGLPFTSQNNTGAGTDGRPSITIGASSAWAGDHPWLGYVINSGTLIYLQTRNTIAGSGADVIPADAATSTNDNLIYFSGMYYTDS